MTLTGDVAQALPCDRHPRLEIPVDMVSAADQSPGQRAPHALYDPFTFADLRRRRTDSLCM